MRVIEIITPAVAATEHGIVVDNALLGLPKQLSSLMLRIMGSNKIDLVPKTEFAPSQADSSLELRNGFLALGGDGLEALAQETYVEMYSTYDRYGLAYRNQEEIRRTQRETWMLSFNKQAWQAAQRGCAVDIFPRTSFSHRYRAVDPELLACPEPVDEVTHRLDNAAILGCRQIRGAQRDLLKSPDIIKVIISLDATPAEVTFECDRDDAQLIWRMDRKLKAIAIARGRELPSIIGRPDFDPPLEAVE